MRSKRGNAMRGVRFCLLVTALALPAGLAGAAERVANALVFAVDVSGSVNTERYELQRAGIAGIFVDDRIEQFLTDGLAVVIMEWSDGNTVVVPWTILRTPGDALALARRIIDVSGDGPNNGPVSTPLARDQVVARGIRVNGLPIVTPFEPDLAKWY